MVKRTCRYLKSCQLTCPPVCGILKILVVKHLESAIRHEHLGHPYAFGSLVVLHYCSHDARQGERRAVKRMAQFGLLGLGIAVTALQAVGLVALEVAYRRNLEPLLLGCAVDLEVIAYSRSEAHVAAAKAQYVVRQFEFLA